MPQRDVQPGIGNTLAVLRTQNEGKKLMIQNYS